MQNGTLYPSVPSLHFAQNCSPHTHAMSSSSSSGYSDEDAETSAPSAPVAPSASQLGQVLELAQICSFCTTFRVPLRLPSFSRTELQEAILAASNCDRTYVELLAELHFKLAREHPTAKMEKMVQDWEKTLARKLQENWRKDFTANPMGGRITYADLTVFERVKILEALCNWKLDTCAEIHKHIATLQKENDVEGINRLRAGEIGTDDKGVSYWYFDDECWIYAEDKPQWQLEERKPSYMVEFANAKRIRLSINFDPDHDSSAPPLRLAVKSVAFADEIKEEKKLKKEETMVQSSTEAKVEVDNDSSDLVKPEIKQVKAEVEKTEKVETTLSSLAKESHATTVETVAVVKKESSTVVETATVEKMNMSVLCASESPSKEERSLQSNGFMEKQDGGSANNEANTDASMATDRIASSVEVQKVNDASPVNAGAGSPGKVNEDASGDHSHATVVTMVGSKKRTIIDDDSSDSDAEFPKLNKDSAMEYPASSSPPPRKKRKASIENSTSAAELDIKSNNDDLTKSISVKVNETTVLSSQSESVTTNAKDESSLVCKSESMAVQETISSSKNADVEAANGTIANVSSVPEEDTQVTTTNGENSTTDASTTDNTASVVKTSGPDSKSPTDPTAAPESFDITCESCKKCYDMRYVDPPLAERPTDEWRCFECLVNDARGWPRRRKSTPREPFSPRTEESSTRRRSSSSKSRSGSSSSKKSKKSSSKSRSSSSSKKKSSHSSSSKRKSSSSSSKKSSSSSSKKHKKRKSSSSSHHHHSSSHGHHRRRHHSHYHHAEFAKLVTLLRERKEQRLGVEEARIKGSLQTVYDEGPQGWRVVSSTLDDLRALIEALSGGSLEQDRLRGRLIVIMKDQEKLEEQRRKQQELAWNILPRRQSSRIAIGRMKNQSTQDSGAEDMDSDEDVESRRPGLRSRRSHSDGVDDNQKHDRAWRARRRHQLSDDEMDLDDEEEEVDSNGVAVPTPGNWIDWSLLKGNDRRLSTVCQALISRLLKEESADLFSRPVDPELDGCPNYLSVIAHPMDLGTIRSRVEASFYRKWELFKKDVELVWQNCRAYNAPDTLVVQFAGLLSKLSRSMCIAAEKKGVDRMKDKSGSDGSENDSDNSMSDASKAESRSSVNKAWTESSGSDSSDSSDANSSSDDSDNDLRSRKQTSTRTSSKKPQTRSRSTRSSRTRSPAKSRSSRNTRSRSSRKRPAPTSSSGESSAFENEVVSPRKSRQPARGISSKVDEKVDPPTEDEDSSDNNAKNHPPPPQNGTPSSSPPPPPPPQAAQKRSKPRLIISDSSSSDDSSDSNSSSGSSSDSDDSDSDAAPVNKPPPPSTAEEAPAPPPPSPSPPPPTASPEDRKPPLRSPGQKTKTTAASTGKKTKTSKAGASSSYTPLLNSYLSPSSSSSSDFSSGDSDSSDSDSD
ncbi:Ankyrin repeat [Phytophthora citrophthora]|uniref:Ankyrin repeat n=1 Tax=Phytophthora citrophthora TaxID=4793 RepID=A0AAD9G346_9STRA|nr:Ankyrin repeat [Phytophthora citrophthora]